MHKSFRMPLIAILVVVAIGGVVMSAYVMVQQSAREAANDPQIQMAEDGAAALATGAVPASLVTRGAPLIDPALSLAPFIAVYDMNGKILESSGVIGGKPPLPPLGVFGNAKDDGENRVTWQPATGTRIATVIVAVDGKFKGFVLAGRSLKEVEKRTGQMEIVAVVSWLAASALVLISLVL